jgi:hypothetical protein
MEHPPGRLHLHVLPSLAREERCPNLTSNPTNH